VDRKNLPRVALGDLGLGGDVRSGGASHHLGAHLGMLRAEAHQLLLDLLVEEGVVTLDQQASQLDDPLAHHGTYIASHAKFQLPSKPKPKPKPEPKPEPKPTPKPKPKPKPTPKPIR
jgi:hypothetical protein